MSPLHTPSFSLSTAMSKYNTDIYHYKGCANMCIFLYFQQFIKMLACFLVRSGSEVATSIKQKLFHYLSSLLILIMKNAKRTLARICIVPLTISSIIHKSIPVVLTSVVSKDSQSNAILFFKSQSQYILFVSDVTFLAILPW